MLQDCELPKYQWEYLKLVDVSIDQLNVAGAGGWELVGLASYQTGGGMTFDGIGSSKYTVHVEYLLKRPIHRRRLIARPDSADLGNSLYRLYLARKYELQHDQIVQVFSFNGRAYGQLDEALVAAHDLEMIEAVDEARVQNELFEKAKSRASAAGVNADAKALMARLDIRFDGDMFVFQTYRYEKLEDAVTYAKRSLGFKD